MERILIFIKHHLKFLWYLIEKVNAALFILLYKRTLDTILLKVLKENTQPPWLFRQLYYQDSQSLYTLIKSQRESDLKYFKPHGFDQKSIKKQFGINSFLMMGVFDNEELIGYFFLRFFTNKKCFVGRLIDENYRGKGIGLKMNTIMYETAWRLGFRCLSTISRNNKAIIKAHSRNTAMVVLKELQNNYLLVEFVK
jgi:RimJ/RimL family protein N-acetyltransferase